LPEAIKIIKKNSDNLIIISNREVQQKLRGNNLDCEILEVGEEKNIDDIKIKGIKQMHGLAPDGSKPDNIGFLIDDKLYHPGDTLYIEDKPYADVVFVPICGTVVMNLKEAAKFVKEINPKLAIPIHYDNPRFPVDVNEFVKETEGYNIKVLKNGESIEID